MKNKTYNKRKVFVVFVIAFILLLGLIGRLVYLMIFEAEYYQKKAEDLHQREREIKAARGKIVDANGVVLATNKSVCTISVIHSQIEDKEEVIRVLSKELGMEEPSIRAKVEKVSSREKIKSNVEIEIGNRIRNYELAGVKVAYGTMIGAALGAVIGSPNLSEAVAMTNVALDSSNSEMPDSVKKFDPDALIPDSFLEEIRIRYIEIQEVQAQLDHCTSDDERKSIKNSIGYLIELFKEFIDNTEA